MRAQIGWDGIGSVGVGVIQIVHWGRSVAWSVGRPVGRSVSRSVKSFDRIDDINEKKRIKIFDMIRVRIEYNRIEGERRINGEIGVENRGWER